MRDNNSMKTKLLLTLAALTTSTSIFAQGYSGVNNSVVGFQGPSQGIKSVQQVLDAGLFSDDMPVTLTGYLKASLGGEMYLFTDGTSDISVEIDHDKWWGQVANPETRVQIFGEIDKDFMGTKIDVEVLKVL